jgi:predicted ester cyclase
MSTEENKAIVRHEIEVTNRGNLTELFATIDEVFAPDFLFHEPGRPQVRSREDYKQFDAAFLAALPGQFTIEDLIAEGDKVVARFSYHGIHQGPWRGVPPTGKAVTFTGTATYHIVSGKVVEVWENMDTLGVLRQLGLISA